MKRILLLIGASAAVFANQAAWITFSPVASKVAGELGVTSHMVGVLAIVYPAFFLALTIPSGLLLDRAFRKWLTLGVALTALGATLRLAEPRDYYWLLACQLLLAVAQPFLLNSFAPLASRLYPERRDQAVSILSLSMYLGIIYAMGTGYWIYTKHGITGLITPVALASLLGLTAYLAGQAALQQAGAGAPAKTGVIGELRRVAGHRELWLLGIILGLGVALFDNMTIWLETVLSQVGLGEIAGPAIAASLLAGLLGVSIIPSIVARKRQRANYIRTAALIGVTVYTILALNTTGTLVALLLPTLGLIMLPAYPIIMEWISTYYPKTIHGASSGFIGFISRIFTVTLATAAVAFTSSTTAYFTFLAAASTAALATALLLPKR